VVGLREGPDAGERGEVVDVGLRGGVPEVRKNSDFLFSREEPSAESCLRRSKVRCSFLDENVKEVFQGASQGVLVEGFRCGIRRLLDLRGGSGGARFNVTDFNRCDNGCDELPSDCVWLELVGIFMEGIHAGDLLELNDVSCRSFNPSILKDSDSSFSGDVTMSIRRDDKGFGLFCPDVLDVLRDVQLLRAGGHGGVSGLDGGDEAGDIGTSDRGDGLVGVCGGLALLHGTGLVGKVLQKVFEDLEVREVVFAGCF